MLEQKEIEKAKELVEEFFEKMTITVSDIKIEAGLSPIKKGQGDQQGEAKEEQDVININIKLEEPQILIGQGGQTLFEIQRLLKTILNRKLQKAFYLNLDINDYKEQKVEYLKDIVKDLADQVARTKEERALSPMSAYERRVVHAELSQRADITTESQGEGLARHIVIKPS